MRVWLGLQISRVALSLGRLAILVAGVDVPRATTADIVAFEAWRRVHRGEEAPRG